MALERWEVDAREFERTTGKDMAELTNLYSFLQMVPSQLEMQVGQLAGGMTYARAKEHVQDQVAAWRDSKPKTGRPTDENMDCGYWDEEEWTDSPEPDSERLEYEGDTRTPCWDGSLARVLNVVK